MKNYSNEILNTPQTQPLLGSNQVKNNAGGYSFEISDQELLERFLLIGTENGTYYVNEDKLTLDNAKKIVSYVQKNGLKVVDTVLDYALNNRAPKADAGLFVLALTSTYGNEEVKQKSYEAISRICKTSTHLFMFLANIQNLRGWSRGLRNGVAKFYTEKTVDKLAYQLVKYRNRAGFTHKDAMRLSHPKAKSPAMNELFSYAVGKISEDEVSNGLINAFGEAQNCKNAELIVDLLKEGLSWEMIPTEFLNDKNVLTALVDNMPLVALIRNLNRFSYNGLTDGKTEVVKKIVSKLTNKEIVVKSGIHPINVVNSLFVYAMGEGQKGNKTWIPNQYIVDALNTTFNYAVETVVPTGKNILIGVDISGSMNSPVGGMSMTASTISNVLATTLLKSEPNAELVWFSTRCEQPTLGASSSLREIIDTRACGGGTDCAQPFMYALNRKTHYDAILILTDNETWAGKTHGATLLQQYRKQINPNVKVVEVAMVSNPYSNLPDNDKNLLRIVGFDASVVSVINSFLK